LKTPKAESLKEKIVSHRYGDHCWLYYDSHHLSLMFSDLCCWLQHNCDSAQISRILDII